jgi:hypothetical protein
MRHRYILSFILSALCAFNLHAREIVRIKSFDGEVIEGRVVIVQEDFRNKIVIDVPSSGPHTYSSNSIISAGTREKEYSSLYFPRP